MAEKLESLGPRATRRLALTRAGLLKPRWTGLPQKARGRGRAAAHQVVRRFGYLQLDSISVAGARTHAIVLLSRLQGFDPSLAEELLAPGEPLFEYWGHEASWLPMELYPAFEFRRREFRVHPWWGDLLGRHPELARDLLARVRDDGPIRSLDLEDDEKPRVSQERIIWVNKFTKKIVSALWSAGDLAVRERRGFQRTFDLTERVIPERYRRRPLALEESLEILLLKALEGHGWASTGTLTATWRLRGLAGEVASALARLEDEGKVVACAAEDVEGRKMRGWARPEDLELAARLERVRPRRARGVLLSPFDPLLWDRARVSRLFGFHQVLEIYKRAPDRIYGYYCLPVLAGDELVARVDLKAERQAGKLRVLSSTYEETRPPAAAREAVRTALARYAAALQLRLVGR